MVVRLTGDGGKVISDRSNNASHWVSYVMYFPHWPLSCTLLCVMVFISSIRSEGGGYLEVWSVGIPLDPICGRGGTPEAS